MEFLELSYFSLNVSLALFTNPKMSSNIGESMGLSSCRI